MVSSEENPMTVFGQTKASSIFKDENEVSINHPKWKKVG